MEWKTNFTNLKRQFAKKAEDFQKNPDRKRAHLESYLEEPSPLFYFGGMSGRKYQAINYNYYCIEDKLKYVNPEIVPVYFSFLKQQVELFF